MNDDLQQQLIKDLLIESFDGLDVFDRELLALEKSEGGPDTFNSIFRIIHTIKGTSGCLGLNKIEAVAHVGESLLSLLRDGDVTMTPPMIEALFDYSDALKEMLRCLEQTGEEGSHDYADLLARLQALQANGNLPDLAPKKEAFGLFDDEAPQAVPAATAPAAPAPAPVAAAEEAVEKQAANRNAGAVSDTAIRVEVAQLDKLMNLVGELVLARNQIVQHATDAQENGLALASQRLNLITTELQENVMKTRMLPIGNTWARFPRIVRDVAQEIGKKVQLVMEGNETELDRTIIEAIKDPLTHIIRNAIDHGIEKPEARLAAGKPEQGLLILRAFHEGGQVNIEIMDDGRGVNIARVKEKAVEKGLITAEQAARLNERDSVNLLFLPGFSTAEKLTNISGRGVGMDVVKTNVEKIGGSVDLQSVEGQGTTVKIKIPLTLAIIPTLIVTTGAERFAIPQVNLLELVRLEADEVAAKIENVFNAPVYRLRGKLLPLIYLSRVLKIAPAAEAGQAAAANIVVVQADGQQFGVVVDEVNDTQEIVVKPLGRFLKGLAVYAGTTILGDGGVALILDVMGLAQYARAVSKGAERRDAEADKAHGGAGAEKQSLLIFTLGGSSRMAMPLASVGRLEKFPLEQVEHEGSQEVVQYRGQIMPLVRLSTILDVATPTETGETIPVVVYTRNGRSVGLVVGEIVDVIDDAVALQNTSRRFGLLGSSVIQGRVTEFVDVPALINQFQPEPANN